MNFFEAVSSGFRNYVNFSGRAVRSEYWYWTLFATVGDVPFFVENCEAVAAKIYVKRRWLGKQGRRVSFCAGGFPERHVTLEVACALLVVGSLWPLPA